MTFPSRRIPIEDIIGVCDDCDLVDMWIIVGTYDSGVEGDPESSKRVYIESHCICGRQVNIHYE